MKKRPGIGFWVAAALLTAASCRSPRIGESLTLDVSWTGTAAAEVPVTVSAGAIRQLLPEFDPADLLLLNGTDTIPFQLSDTNADGTTDELFFLGSFNGAGIQSYTLKTGVAGLTSFSKRTQAMLSVKTGGTWKDGVYEGGSFTDVTSLRVPDEHSDHSGFIRFEGPGWESDRVAYRYYLDWRNATDIFGKLTDTMVLQHVGQEGLESYHNLSPWGMDVFKVAESLGVGSVAMWANGQVNMVSVTDSLFCSIVLNGPLRSMVETRYHGWQVGDKKQTLLSRLSIVAGSRLTCHDLRLEDPAVSLCTGLIMNDTVNVVTNAAGNDPWVYFGTWGLQSLNHDSLGIAVLVNRNDLQEITADKMSHVLVFKPGRTSLRYYFAAAWEKEPGGIRSTTEFEQYLREQVAMLAVHPVTELKKKN